ncbi:DUF29 domain-containing protein [Salinarimonas soli]|uniref:DUF29 domain-containing protein n=1 Tax=Salinarimonas soli TaxID=1638099 RepID=A0A5B2VGY6_9HYPH|nr:DUF29 domain-containing protein [Salinarimonas soli]KAA2237770.1 DUF29 domain-containing protein [Salinarimonas soli]
MSFAKHPKPQPAPAAYEEDAYTWALEQAALLRAGRFEAIDVENIAEEIETVGRSEFARLRSSFRIIMLHLLKRDRQPERRSRSWVSSILTHRLDAAETLAENPGLKSRVSEALAGAYARARIEAIAETGLPEGALPETCPYDLDAVMTREIQWAP